MEKEIVIVDKDNKVVGTSTRSEAYKKGLWHRIAVVYVFNSRGKLYLQKRSAQMEVSPGKWDHSAAGHVDANEEPEQAAKREIYEELGIKPNLLVFISSHKTQMKNGSKILNRFWYLYKYTYDGGMKLEEKEVTTGKFVDVNWLKKDLKEKPDIYTYGLKASLNAYLKSL